jgi:hypothetical protein
LGRPEKLPEILKGFPELRPGLAQIVTQVNGTVADRFIILNVEGHADRRDQRAALEIRQKTAIKTHHE